MIGASKILTVSYGTFSCTLEGFDDSFSTMKAIAEYFRDLAADDRYFGAEPPTPDAEMLAKIAGRQTNRQVEAKVEDNGITLRPLIETEAAEVVAAPIEQPVATPEPAAPAVSASIVSAPTTDHPVTNQTAPNISVSAAEYDDTQDEAHAELISPIVAQPVEDADTESVAAKLRRIRAVVAQNQTTGTAVPFFNENAAVDDLLPEQEPQTDANAEAEQQAKAEADAKAEAEAEQQAKAEADAKAEAEAEQQAKAEADAKAEAEAEQQAKAEADAKAEAEQEMDAEDEDEADANAELEANALSNILDLVSNDINDDVTEVTQSEPEPTDLDLDAGISAAIAAEVNVESADDQPVIAEVLPSDDHVETITDIDEQLEENDDTSSETNLNDTKTQKIQPSRVRISIVKKADLNRLAEENDDATISNAADASNDEAVEQEATELAADPLGKTNLSPEDEAELLAELADVELDTPLETDDGINATMRIERTSRVLSDAGGAKDEASVSRLLNEANAKLGTDESARRRSAISHLRAAVAATVAERKFTKSDIEATPDQVDAYRTDLADVIRPQRPTAKGGTRPSSPAPLILVSEQRIDHKPTASQSNQSPIQPRRIRKNEMTLHEVETAAPLGLAGLDINEDSTESEGTNIFADSTSFADFADKMSATELPDLLEAAAAYTAYVEGRPHFARPQIMRQVAGFTGKDEFNREEGLRSFGQLLRQGKIIKIKRGQFEIAKNTRFNPEARFAGE